MPQNPRLPSPKRTSSYLHLSSRLGALQGKTKLACRPIKVVQFCHHGTVFSTLRHHFGRVILVDSDWTAFIDQFSDEAG